MGANAFSLAATVKIQLMKGLKVLLKPELWKMLHELNAVFDNPAHYNWW